MRALEILQEYLTKNLDKVHAQRVAAVWRAVDGLMHGGRLWLTALGRDLPGRCDDKHRIKAIDRLLGNKGMHAELPRFYCAMAKWLLRRTKEPTLLVDWTGVGARHHLLTAALCFSGRALPIFSQVYPDKMKNGLKAQTRFLRALADIIPADCTPIIVTDAGFHSAWFEQVAQLGWHFVGRIRANPQVKIDEKWVLAKSLYKHASNAPKNLGKLWLYKSHPLQYRFVVSKRPKKGRKRKTTEGKRRVSTMDTVCASQNREPWLLVTSLQCNAKIVVGIYGMRMQIEESFRDLKNHRHGWALRHIGCRTTQRIEVLLMIAALANVAMHIIGLAAEQKGLQRQYQANTIRSRRVFSLFVLGKLVLARGTAISNTAYNHAYALLNEIIMARSPPGVA